MEHTHLIKSLKHILGYFQPILFIYESGRLIWSLVGKINPSKTIYLKFCETERSIVFTKTCQRGHGK
jgi:hypothetical protein